MGHLVRYSSAEGEERYEDVADLDAAVARVERLRNDEGVSDVRVYREVPLEFRTYVRVEVADSDAPSSSSSSSGSGTSRDAGPAAGGPSTSAEAPSGAAVISPPPATSATQVAEPQGAAGQADVEARAAENRRISLFNRGQAS